jgi:hypothetical protein
MLNVSPNNQNGAYGQNLTAIRISRCADITKTPTPIFFLPVSAYRGPEFRYIVIYLKTQFQLV